MSAGPGFAATRFQASATVEYWGPNDGLLAVEWVHAGRLAFETGEGQFLTGAGEIGMVPPDGPWVGASEEVDLAPLLLDVGTAPSRPQ